MSLSYPAAVFEVPVRPSWLARPVPAGALAAVIAGWLAGDQLLLWRFLGIGSPLAYAGGALAAAALVAGAARLRGPGPSRGELLMLLAVALALYALGGEGRFFYANTDWRVREGVLRDLAAHPWPFALLERGVPELLRAPLGLYLLPALVMKIAGTRAGEIALLAQNAVLLAAVLGLAAPLFARGRARVVALVVFVAFSGMDWPGALLVDGWAGLRDHLEWWSGLQYSSTVTLAFWAPQHALAGWIAAAAYLRWRERMLPTAALLASVPLLALWSPLAALGALPFVALAIPRVRLRDLPAPALASLLAAPGLLYLAAGSGAVGGGIAPVRPADYAMFEALEALPVLLIAATARTPARWGRGTLAVTAAVLLLLPLVRVGPAQDLLTRASIPALAVLAATAADLLRRERGGRRALLAAVLAVGALTPLHEIARAWRWPAAPAPRCGFYGMWGPSAPGAKSTYLAPLASLPRALRPAAPALVPPGDPARCWDGPWPRPSGI